MTQETNLPETPPSFQDSEKRSWTIKLTLRGIDTIRDNTKLDLAPRDVSDIDPVLNLLFDDRALGDVLWWCIHKQASKINIDKDSFFEALDGEALRNGWGALVDAIVFFTRSKSPTLARAIVEGVEKKMRFIEMGASKMVEAFKSQTTDEALRKRLDELGDQMQRDLIEGLAVPENSATP